MSRERCLVPKFWRWTKLTITHVCCAHTAAKRATTALLHCWPSWSHTQRKMMKTETKGYEDLHDVRERRRKV